MPAPETLTRLKQTHAPQTIGSYPMPKQQQSVKFAKFDADEAAAVDTIVLRAVDMFKKFRVMRTAMSIRMDISAVHATNPLRLADLAAADDFNFSHDIGGIDRHLDRSTGKLGDFFSPRFSARPEADNDFFSPAVSA